MDDLKARYRTAKQAFTAFPKLVKVSELMLKFIEHKEKGQATQEIYDKAVDYIGKQLDGTINNDGFLGLCLYDLKIIGGY